MDGADQGSFASYLIDPSHKELAEASGFFDLSEPQGEDHVYHLFIVRTLRRDALRSFLNSRGIQTGLQYTIALHHQPCFVDLPSAGESVPSAEVFAGGCLSLPFFSGMTDAQRGAVIDAVRAFFTEQ